ncbi:MAG: hypothetical protein M5U05_16740 [Anaerolineales bacterium]|jgi:glucan phosphoethanolaminetransferase (alkaline phosphatase superfamily)|nr:hypothetical protein [Anaerolineales bacterium]
MKTSIIVMSILSILCLLVATFFGAWIHANGNIVVDGTNLLEVHIVQGIGTVIINLITFGLIIFTMGGKKKIITIIASLLCISGLALSCFAGWFLNQYDGLIGAFARKVNAHSNQAISTAILTIIFLVLMIMLEMRRNKKQEDRMKCLLIEDKGTISSNSNP